MELNWSTFLLEIINFLVLVWILKHFFYKPVLNVIAVRQADILGKLTDASQLEVAARLLETQYKNRLSEWENEKHLARQTLHDEINRERLRLLDEVQEAIEQEREKSKTQDQRRLQRLSDDAERKSLEQSASFVARLLSRLSSPELEVRIAQLVLEDLETIPDANIRLIRREWDQSENPIEICSVYPIDKTLQQEFEISLGKLLQRQLKLEFKQVPALISGIRITTGSWLFEASIANELKSFFQQSTYETQ